jgi:hypothetical protein
MWWGLAEHIRHWWRHTDQRYHMQERQFRNCISWNKHAKRLKQCSVWVVNYFLTMQTLTIKQLSSTYGYKEQTIANRYSIIIIIIIIIILWPPLWPSGQSALTLPPPPIQSVGLLGRGVSPTQGLYLYAGQHRQSKHTQTSMPRVGFPPTIQLFERVNAVHALDREDTVIG